MGKRRLSRELALQAMYLIEASGLEPHRALFSISDANTRADIKATEFALSLINGATTQRGIIDKHLQETAKNWTLERMAAVDRNILRLAAFELIFKPETPISVIIDEAIEITRKYSTEDATKFVNGILDKIKEKRELA